MCMYKKKFVCGNERFIIIDCVLRLFNFILRLASLVLLDEAHYNLTRNLWNVVQVLNIFLFYMCMYKKFLWQWTFYYALLCFVFNFILRLASFVLLDKACSNLTRNVWNVVEVLSNHDFKKKSASILCVAVPHCGDSIPEKTFRLINVQQCLGHNAWYAKCSGLNDSDVLWTKSLAMNFFTYDSHSFLLILFQNGHLWHTWYVL